MKIESAKLKDDFHGDIYWTKLYIISDDGSKTTAVLIGASHEFLWDLFKTKDLDKVKLGEWLNNLEQEWNGKDDTIFSKLVHYQPYATTQESKANVLEFLETKFTP